MKLVEPAKIVILLLVLTGIFKDFAFDRAAFYSFWCAIGLSILIVLRVYQPGSKDEERPNKS